MGYTPPNLSQVLTNEQTMNSRLTTCRNDLRAILTKEEIGYTSGDAIIPLIRKLPVPQLNKIEVEMPQSFSTGSDLTVNVKTTDTNNDSMANVNVDLYRVYIDPEWYSTKGVHLGQVTTDSRGEASSTIEMPQDKGWFYIQARSGNVVGGHFGGYCTDCINAEDFSFSTWYSNLFSQHGVGSSSLLDIVDYDENEEYVDITIEKEHASAFSSSFGGIKLDSLGTFTKSQTNPMFAILEDTTNSNNTYWMGFGLAFNTDAWSTPILAAGAKFMYGDGSGEYGFRQVMEGIPDFGSNNNGTPQPAGNPRLFYAGGDWSYTACVYDEYASDPTAQYPSDIVRHGNHNWNMSYFGPSGNAKSSILFNFPDSSTYRTFRFYGAGVI